MSDFLGIDLGSSTTVAAVCNFTNGNSTFNTVGDAHGSHVIPSMVCLSINTPDAKSGSKGATNQVCLVGANAKEELLKTPKNVFTYTNSMIGRSFHHPAIQEMIPELQYEIEPVNEMVSLVLQEGGHKYNYDPEKFAALILASAQSHARLTVKNNFKKVVITVPATAGSLARQGYKRAALMAGLNDVVFIPEPVAIAINYVYEQRVENLRSETGSKNYLIIDIGGFSTKASIVNFNNNKFTVLASEESEQMSGKKITQAIYSLVARKLKGKGIDLSDPRLSKLRAEVMAECESIKCDNSDNERRCVNYTDPSGKMGVVKIKLADIESEVVDIFQNADELFEAVSKAAGSPHIDRIIFAGTSTRIAAVTETWTETIDATDAYEFDDMTAACALGASIFAAHLSGSAVVPGISGPISVQESVPMNLNVAIARGRVLKLIGRGSKFPAKSEEQHYKTVNDNQESFDIKIYEGNTELRRECVLAAEASKGGVPKAEKGKQSIRVYIEAREAGATPDIYAATGNEKPVRLPKKMQKAETVTGEDKDWVKRMLTQ